MAKAKKPKRRKLNALELQRRRAFNFIFEDDNYKFADRLYPAGEPNWEDQNIRSAAANGALAFNFFLEPRSGDFGVPEPALQKAFETFSLDGMNPYHWRFLLGILATAVFGKAPRKAPKPKRPVGRPPKPSKWTEARDARLSEQIKIVDLVVSKFDWKPTRTAIGEIIRATFPEYRLGDEKRIAREISRLRKK